MSIFTGNLISAVLVGAGFLYLPVHTSWWVATLSVILGIIFWAICLFADKENLNAKMQLEYAVESIPKIKSATRQIG